MAQKIIQMQMRHLHLNLKDLFSNRNDTANKYVFFLNALHDKIIYCYQFTIILQNVVDTSCEFYWSLNLKIFIVLIHACILISKQW